MTKEFPTALLTRLAAADFIIGTDEVGYGAWAGNLIVAAVLVPKGWVPPVGLTDSKKVTEASSREKLYDMLLADPLVRHRIHSTSPEKLDELGVAAALNEAHRALHMSFHREEPTAFCIADGNLVLGLGIHSEPKADLYVPAVSAASIIAKVTRDREMVAADTLYPGYSFASHKGYGGDERHAHMKALRKLGVCPIHRRSYRPISQLIQEHTVDEPLTAWEVTLPDGCSPQAVGRQDRGSVGPTNDRVDARLIYGDR